MTDLTTKNFGLLIAYLLPGFTLIWGLRHLSPALKLWLSNPPDSGPTVGGFLFATLASIGAGLTLSTVRWLVIDTLHHRTGVTAPVWDFSTLPGKLAEFDLLNEQHYRYYQAYGNLVVALIALVVIGWMGPASGVSVGSSIGLLSLSGLFLIGSRDALRKYYSRVEGLLLIERKLETDARRDR